MRVTPQRTVPTRSTACLFTRITTRVLAVLAGIWVANATTYYIDFGTGSDANNGTSKTTPWKRAPYMAGFTGLYTHSAGDRFIFKGGTTWDATCFGYMEIRAGGSSTSNVDYYGVDPTWYAGASWTRPIFDCQSQRQSMILIGTLSTWTASAAYVTFDNIEMCNLYWSANQNYGVVSFVNQVTGTHDIIFQNCYLHDWTHGSYSGGARDCMSVFVGAGANSPFNAGCVVTNCVIDGGAANAVDYSSSGAAFLQWGGQVRNCTIKNCVSAILVGQGNPNSIVAGNNIGPTWHSFDSASHDNGLEVNFGGSPHYFYNNVTHDTKSVCWMIGGNGGEVDYCWNNLFYNNSVYPIQLDTTVNGTTEYIWNNTFAFSGYCVRGNYRASTSTLGVVSLINNHAITDSGIWTANGVAVTSFTNANTIAESTAQGTTDGYTLANMFQPSSTLSPTVGKGQDMSAQLSGSLDTDLIAQSRPGASGWDSGAYSFHATSTADTVAPTVQISAPTNGSTVSGKTPITISSSDNVGVVNVYCYLDGALVASSAASSMSLSWDTTTATNGSHTIKATAYDAANNVGTTSVTVTVSNTADTTAPTVKITSPTSGATVSQTVSVGVSSSDNVGVTKVEFYLNGTLAGSSTSATPTFSWNTTTGANGSYTLQAKAYDAAGNVGTSASIVTVSNSTADTTAPTVQITSPANGTIVSQTVNVGVSSSDNVGVTKVELYLNGALAGSSTSATPTFSWNTTTGANGSYTLQAKAYDAAGNVGTSASITVTVSNTTADTTAPTAQITSPANGATVSQTVNVGVSSSDNVGVTKVELYLNGALAGSSTSATPTFSWNTTTGANGSYILQAKAYDAAGNVGTSASITVTVSNTTADTTAPTVQITSPANGATVSQTVSVGVSSSDNVGVTKVELYLNGTLFASSTSGTPTFSWDTTTVANGSYTLQAKAYDAAGNIGTSTSLSVTVSNTTADTTAPTVQITSPANGATVSQTVSVGVSSSDNVGVTKVELYLNGTLFGSSTSATPSFSWDTTTVANGSYTLQAKAYDAAGNVGASTTVTVTVQNAVADTTPPTVQITSPADGTTVSRTTAKVSVSASDNVGVTKVSLYIDGTLYATDTSAPYTFSWNTSKTGKGTHTLQAYAYDAAGNVGTSAIVNVTK